MATVWRTAHIARSYLPSSSRRLFSPKVIPIGSSAALHNAILRQSQALNRRSIPPFASFTTTSGRNILPPGPQVIEGGVNDPAPVPHSNPIHGSYHWTFERLLAVGLVPLTIAPFAAGSVSPTLDAALVFAILVHSHIGFQSCVIDYFPIRQHPTMRKIATWLLNIATLVVGIGFYEFETNDVGLTEAIKRIWHAGENDATVGKADLGGLGHDAKIKALNRIAFGRRDVHEDDMYTL